MSALSGRSKSPAYRPVTLGRDETASQLVLLCIYWDFASIQYKLRRVSRGVGKGRLSKRQIGAKV